MRNARDAEFCAVTTQFYRRNFAAQLGHVGDNEIFRRVSEALEKARGLGVYDPDATTQFIAMAVFAGPSFLIDPVITDFMSNSEFGSDVLVRELIKRVVIKLRSVLAAEGLRTAAT